MTPEVLYILYGLLGIGAAGVALAMPSATASARRLRLGGVVLGACALAGLGVFWCRWLGPSDRAAFIVFAAVAVLAAARVITHPRPVYSALYFVLVVLAVTGLCVLASAEFLGIALVIVYAGAILVTYIFVIMLAQQTGTAEYDHNAREPWAALAIAFVLVAGATQAMSDSRLQPGPSADRTTAALVPEQPAAGNVRAIGTTLLTTYVIALELAGVLLLTAMVGAIAIAQKRVEPEDLTPLELAQQAEDEDVHRAGRTAAPF